MQDSLYTNIIPNFGYVKMASMMQLPCTATLIDLLIITVATLEENSLHQMELELLVLLFKDSGGRGSMVHSTV